MGVLALLLGCAGSGGEPADSSDTAPGDTSSDTAAEAEDTANDSGEEPKPPPFEGMHLFVPVTALLSADEQGEMLAGVAASRGMVAASPDTGPGKTRDSAWGTLFSNASSSGVTTVGFVRTDGGARDSDDVSRDLGRYAAWYESDGAWFSTADAAGCSAIEAYGAAAKLADGYDAGKDAFVVVQSELDCAELLDVADVVVVAAEPADAFMGRKAFSWMGAESPERFGAWVWGTSAGDLEGVFAHAESLGIGKLYVTDAAEADAFSRLPSYWSEEVSLVAE
jgi:hypothetical protein